MIITFLLEIGFALYVLFRYKLTAVSRLATAVLVGLAIFQLAEFNVCEGAWGVDSLTWARIGHAVITLLPALGIHLATKLAGQKQPLLVGAGYVSAAAFAFIFMFVGHGMTAQECLGNYVIFSIAPQLVIPYTIYYYGWLLIAVAYALWQATKQKKKPAKSALVALAIGYLAFIIPTTAVTIVDPSTLAGIPSIMCGFAVILALVLTLKVVPAAHQGEKVRH